VVAVVEVGEEDEEAVVVEDEEAVVVEDEEVVVEVVVAAVVEVVVDHHTVHIPFRISPSCCRSCSHHETLHCT
jgi:hypothetical protein